MAQNNLQGQSDQELQFKKRARRRLVGAVALVLLMIVVLPMILRDRTAQAPKQDVVISIPSQDQTLGQDANADKAQTSAVAAAPIQATAPISESAPATADTKAAEAKPAEVQQTPVAPSEPVKQEPAKVETKATVSSSYFVQIGVFSDPDNIKQMQEKLSSKGLKSSAELIDTAKGKKTRLRVGPFDTKKDAESAMDKLKSLSLTGVIVSAN